MNIRAKVDRAKAAPLTRSNNDPRRDATVRRLCCDLESQICDVNNMAYVAVSAVEEAIGSDPISIDRYLIPADQRDAVVFALFHLQGMIQALKTSYYAAIESGDMQ